MNIKKEEPGNIQRSMLHLIFQFCELLFQISLEATQLLVMFMCSIIEPFNFRLNRLVFVNSKPRQVKLQPLLLPEPFHVEEGPFPALSGFRATLFAGSAQRLLASLSY